MSNMGYITDISIVSGALQKDDATCKLQYGNNRFQPIMSLKSNTFNDFDGDFDPVSTNIKTIKRSFEAPAPRLLPPTSSDTIPLQIWEGTVINVDYPEQVMHVMLDAKMGQTPRHAAEIELEWVTDQDEDLVVPGAVFYLTLYKETKRGSINNSQELRFRRRPSWSKPQLNQIDKDVAKIHAKMRALPFAE